MNPVLLKPTLLIIAVTVFLLTTGAQAQVKRDPKLRANNTATAQAASLSDSNPIEAFKLAKAAVAQQDLAKFNRVASAAAEHPLGMYVDYWALRLRLAQAARADSTETVDSNLAAQATAYLNKFPTSIAADLLRRDWILAAGKQNDWNKIESLNKDWVLQDDKHALCYGAWLHLKKTSTIEASVKDSLVNAGALQEGCDLFAVDAAKLGKLSSVELQTRILSAVFANNGSSVRRLVEGSPSWSALPVDAIWSNPQATLNATTRQSREAVLLALLRLAVQDPIAGANALRADKVLANADKALAASFIAAVSARKTQPEAAALVTQAAKFKGKTQLSLPDEVAIWATRAALRGQDWESISAMIDTMGSDGRRDPAWIYWKAKADKNNGVPKEIFEKDFASIAGQHHFYGQLAGEELGQLVKFPSPTEAAEDPVNTAGNLAAVNAVIKGAAVARALQFYELNMRFEGNREWNWAIRGLSDKQLLAVSRWAYKQQLFDRAVSTAERTQQQHDYSARLITPFKEPLSAAAARYNLDPAYVYGLVKQESRFLVEVKSSVGATGLMQLMPATAKWVAKRINLDDFDLAQLGHPETNLNMGSFYLRTVMDGLDGNPGLAAAAYNAGPNRPRNWRANLVTKIDGAAFAESIPFTETRDYVKKVLSNTVLYAAMFTGQPQSLKARLGEIAPKTAIPADTP